MGAGYGARLRELQQAAAEAGVRWVCADCGATGKALTFWPVDGATVAVRARSGRPVAWVYGEIMAGKPLLCTGCRWKRDRALARAALLRELRGEGE